MRHLRRRPTNTNGRGGAATSSIKQISNKNVRKGTNMNSSETTHNPLDGITATLEKALQQAREQADTIINDARKQAERIINDARTQADTIIADAQADARYRDDMERASLAIQEHAAALHTLALGLTEHETTPHDNATRGADNSATDTNTNADANEADESNTNANDASTIPPAPTATATDTTNATTPTNTSRANTPTTRRADGTTRKLAPWEQPEETHASDTNATTEHNNEPERSATTGDTAAPQWDTPLIIDAPLQL